MSRRRYKKAKKGNWQHLIENEELRTAFLRFARSIHTAEESAEQIAVRAGRPASQFIDLREAGRILDRYPQLSGYLLSIRERQEELQDAQMRHKESPTHEVSQAAALGGWAGYQNVTPQGVPNARALRNFADECEFVAASINHYCDRISRFKLTVLPIDEQKPYNRSVEKEMIALLENPNELGDTVADIVSTITRDYLTIGRGIISKAMSVRRIPTTLYMEDAALFRIDPKWSGNAEEPRYLYQPNSQTKIPLRNDEIICLLCGPSTFRLSFSPVQILRNTILSDLKATESASRLVEHKPPPHLVQLPGASAAQIDRLRSTYDADIAGHREIMFLGGPNPAQIKPMIFSLRDNQWMEWLEYLARKIAVVFGLSIQDLSFTGDVNRATATSQQELSESKGLIPLMLRIEMYFHHHLLSDFAPKRNGIPDMRALNLRVAYPEIGEAMRMLHVEQTIHLATKSLAGLPSQTLNQVLTAQGLEPVPGGNTFYLKTATGAIPWLSYDNDFGPTIQENPTEEENNSQNPTNEEENKSYRTPKRATIQKSHPYDKEARDTLGTAIEHIFHSIEKQGSEQLRRLQ